jgi:hypothetical protein
MRSTFRIDDDLLVELKARARRENVSLTRLLNRILRAGMQAARGRRPPRRRHQERTHAMGTPRVDLRKALGVAADLESEEIVRKAELRK